MIFFGDDPINFLPIGSGGTQKLPEEFHTFCSGTCETGKKEGRGEKEKGTGGETFFGEFNFFFLLLSFFRRMENDGRISPIWVLFPLF